MPAQSNPVAAVAKLLGGRGLSSAGFWALGGSGLAHAMRLGTNLLVTRAVAPEAFGLAALVTAVMVGFEMMSDLGIRAAISSSTRIDDPVFLRTCWTVQLVRGTILAAVVAAAALPIAALYGEEQVGPLLLASSVSFLLRGAGHVCEVTLSRQFRQRRLVAMQLSIAAVTSLVTVFLAWTLESAWALVLGGILGEVVRLVATHVVGRSCPMRLCWDSEALSAVRTFGRWVFATSLLTLVVTQGDRILMGRLLSLAELGYYALAVQLAGLVGTLLSQLNTAVLLPLHAQEGRTTTSQFRDRLFNARAIIGVVSLPPLILLSVFGDQVLMLFWDSRYWEAGWMIRVLALGRMMSALGNVGAIHFVRGETWVSFVTEGVSAVALVAAVFVGHWLAGTEGIVVGVALASSPRYFLSVWLQVRYGLLIPRKELALVVVACIGLLLCEAVRVAALG
jgi:O-antigen/teichoic acid export membrane protein